MNLRFNPAQIALGAVCGVLLLALGYLLFAPIPEIAVPQVQARTQPVDEDDDAPLPRFDAPSKQAFAEVDDRLVFNPQRVRVVAPAQPGATGTTLPSDLSLVGVIMDGDTKLALFKSSAQPLAVGVTVGGSIDGWQVTRVEADRVALRSGGAEQEMKFSSTNPPPGPEPARGPNIGPPRMGPPGMGGPNFRPPFMRNNVNNNGENPNANNNNNPNNNNGNNNNNNNNDDDDDN